MKVKSVIKGYRLFRNEGRANNAPANPLRYAQYAKLRKRWGGITREDFFKERLYDNTQSHEAYLEQFLKYTRSWKYVTKKYHPDAGKGWLFWHRCDYLISKIIYPGLDAMDYISYEFYKFRYEKRKTFVTEGDLQIMVKKFNRERPESLEAANLIRNKVQTNRFFSRFIRRRWVAAEDMTREAMESFCEGLKEILVKPAEDSCGHGIYKASVGTPEEREKLYEEVAGKPFILEEILVQHEVLAKLNPNSVNTYRIYSCNDGANKVTITSAAMRIGGGEDYVDNFHRGGMAASVDVETGIVVSRAIDFNGESAIIHPYTGEQIFGLKLPEWEKALELVRQAHAMLPAMGYIAWDVAMCRDGSATLVEANGAGDVGLQQIPGLTGLKPLYAKLLREREENLRASGVKFNSAV